SAMHLNSLRLIRDKSKICAHHKKAAKANKSKPRQRERFLPSGAGGTGSDREKTFGINCAEMARENGYGSSAATLGCAGLAIPVGLGARVRQLPKAHSQRTAVLLKYFPNQFFR